MFKRTKIKNSAETTATSLNGELATVLDRTHATIAYAPDGTVLNANANFLALMEYELSDIQGQNHAMFMDAAQANSPDYMQVWTRLQSGDVIKDQFEHVTKSGAPAVLQATYCPIMDDTGHVQKILVIATDVTERRTQLTRISDALSALSAGDLYHRIPDCDIADLAKIGDIYNGMIAHLSDMIMNVKQISGDVYATSQDMAGKSLDLSRRTENQASTLEETAAAVEQLTTNASTAAQNATSVNGLAIETRDSTKSGQNQVSDLTGAMEKIKQSSEQISQIVSVIENIAFQTNLLALNAGVEAARAGESGRGFAVVASEVRGLAQRSSESAMEIKTLIDASGRNVNEGVTMVEQVASEFGAIFEGVSKISQSVQEISQNMGEQATTLHEINAAVTQLDRVTQDNAAMVNQTSLSVDGLSAGARSLIDEVSRFGQDAAPSTMDKWQNAG